MSGKQPTSFAELEATKERRENIDSLVGQLGDLVHNVIDLPDRADRVKSLLSEFAQRLGVDESDPVAAQAREPFQPRITFTKAADGTYRWLTVYSNSFRDDDLIPEIISSKSQRRFVEMVDKGVYPMPELWLYHEPQWKWGEALVVATDDVAENISLAIAAGKVDKDKGWLAEAFMATGKAFPVSHGMPGPTIKRDPDNPTVIVEHQTREISPLPHGKEANSRTIFFVLKENNMAISKDKRDEMAKALEIDPDALLSLETANKGMADEAVADGVQAKAKAGKPPMEEDEDEEEEKAVAEKEAGTGDDVSVAELAQFVGAVIKSVTEALTLMRQDIDELKQNSVVQQENDREKQVEAVASTIYKQIMGAAAGQGMEPEKRKEAALQSEPKVAKKEATNMAVNGRIVPPIIQKLAQNSANTVSGFTGLRNGVQDYEEA